MIRRFDSIASSPRLTGGASPAPAAQASFHGGAPEQAIFRLDLGRSFAMHRSLVLGFALAGAFLAALYVAMNWRVYTAESLVYIQPTPSPVLEGAAPVHWPYNYDPATYDSYIQQQMLSMTRPGVLAGAIAKLGPGPWRRSGESGVHAAERLKGMVEVARVGTSYQVGITAHASTPAAAAVLANAVAASYIENTSHEMKAGDADRLAMLKEERDRVKKELDADRTEQAALNAQIGVAAIGPIAPEHYDDDIARMHDALVKARTDHDEAAARLTSLDASNGPGAAALDAEADQLIASDPGLASLKQSLLTRRAQLVSQMANLTPSHPQYKQDQEEIRKIDASLASQTQQLRTKAAARIEERLRADLDRTSSLEARLNGELARMTRAAAGATPKLQRLSDLANDIARLQTRFNSVDEQLRNQMLEDSAPGAAHVAEAAVPPLHPSEAGVIRNAILLLLIFAGLGLAIAVVRHKLDPRVYIASDVERLLGYAPMAQLPDFDEVSDKVAAEHLLRLASAIDYAAKDGGLTSCVFTGAGPGVGVTMIASHVKAMLSALGQETVLVNASGLAPEPLGDTLADSTTELAHAAQPARPMPQPGEAVSSARDGASSQENLVLTDTAPLAVSAEAEYMARRADCTILVIESAKTTRAELRAAAAILQRLDTEAVGFVLNRVSLRNADESFRHSVSEVERHVRQREQSAAQAAPSLPAAPATPPSRDVAPEPAAAASMPPAAVGREAPPKPRPIPAAAQMAETVVPPPVDRADAAPAPSTPEPPPEPVAESSSSTANLPEPQPEEEPWWMMGLPMHAEIATVQPSVQRMENWQSDSEYSRPKPAVPAPEPVAAAAEAPPTRLSGLRGLLFTAGVKSLAPKDDTASRRNQSGSGERPVNLAQAFAASTRRELAVEFPAPSVPSDFDQASAPQPVTPAVAPPTEIETAQAPVERTAVVEPAPQRVTAEPEFLPPSPPEETAKDKEPRRETRNFAGSIFDDIQILPAKRGQYRR
ncbi:MAG: GumC family protein [Terracidiphilus sp.]